MSKKPYQNFPGIVNAGMADDPPDSPSSNTLVLNFCPFCGGAARWCADNEHECHLIVCDDCKISVDFQENPDVETVRELQAIMAVKWNRREIATQLWRERDAAKVEAAKLLSRVRDLESERAALEPSTPPMWASVDAISLRAIARSYQMRSDDIDLLVQVAGRLEMLKRSAEPPNDDLRAALVHAVSVIQTWHNMDVPAKDRSDLWDIYWKNAPEMKPIRAALTKEASNPWETWGGINAEIKSEQCSDCDTPEACAAMGCADVMRAKTKSANSGNASAPAEGASETPRGAGGNRGLTQIDLMEALRQAISERSDETRACKHQWEHDGKESSCVWCGQSQSEDVAK